MPFAAAIRHGVGAHDGADRAERGKRGADRFARCAEIDGKLEPPQHGGEPVGKIAGNAIKQKRRDAQNLRAPPPPPN
jgi:hypothetical protein